MKEITIIDWKLLYGLEQKSLYGCISVIFFLPVMNIVGYVLFCLLIPMYKSMFSDSYTFSKIPAAPMPPPIHMDTMP